MEVPVCILSYNHPQITARAIQSCLNFLPPAQIFILHNGSEDKHAQSLRAQFPQITHWVIEENKGYTGGVNEILRRGFVISPWLLILTNDCELLGAPKAPPEPGLYGVRTWARKMGRLDSCLGKVNFLRGNLQHLHTPEMPILKTFEKFYVHGAAFLLHREVYEKVGTFDETLHTYCEDLDYSMRVNKAGFPLALAPEFEVLHHIGRTCHKDPQYTTYYYQRNRRRVCLRHCPPEYLGRLKFSFLIENFQTKIRLLFRCKKKHLALFQQAIRDV